MGRWAFKILLYPLLYLISLLPFPLLYLKSSFFYVLVYYVIGYRRKVVKTNLQRSFPEKNEKEIALITRRFYLHFCDVIFETIKLLSISKKTFKKRCAMDPGSAALFQTRQVIALCRPGTHRRMR